MAPALETPAFRRGFPWQRMIMTGCAWMVSLHLTWAAPSPDPSDPVAGRSHWAFQPLRFTTPPSHPEWSRTQIDDFIAAKRGEANLEPAPDASKRDLLRRLTFQIHGLPPSPEQVERFLHDERPDALERLVDELLDSPRFGERWGRHWLDLARYADSNGLDENFLFREAWRYRNWVIEALNGDLPYDRFLLEQLAGDLLPFDSIEQRDAQRIASGFLVLGPKVLLGNNPKNQKMEVADEQIDTLGRALLGLTLGCARCHDHKFEPIPTADYYALAGIFTSTEVMEQRYMLGQQRVMERLVGLGAEGDAKDSAYETYWKKVGTWRGQLAQAKTALELLRQNDAAGFKRHSEKHPDSVAEAAKEGAGSDEARLAQQEAKVAALEQKVKQAPPIPPRAMIPQDVDQPADEAIRLSGHFDRPSETVPRGFLQVIRDSEAAHPPLIPQDASGRKELAQWLTDPCHGAGRLTARVMANRVWHHLMGRGLVRTVDNFGRTGETPSHPELLDYLASELIASEWSLKSLIRAIALSRTFAMSSQLNEQAYDSDPENRLFWRSHRRRLDPESLRDAMLAAADALDFAWVDSTVNYLGDQATAVGKNENRRRTDFPCRSVYLPVIRNDLPEIFEVFDFADPHATTGARPETTSATQGLFLMNDPMVMATARTLAHRILKQQTAPEARWRDGIDHLFHWGLQTAPSEEERRRFQTYLQTSVEQFQREGAEAPHEEAWTLACHALFALSRFQFVD